MLSFTLIGTLLCQFHQTFEKPTEWQDVPGSKKSLTDQLLDLVPSVFHMTWFIFAVILLYFTLWKWLENALKSEQPLTNLCGSTEASLNTLQPNK